MAKHRKLTVIVEAVQYVEYGKLVKGMCNSRYCAIHGHPNPHVHLMHKYRIISVEVGDWIVAEPDGKHFYPVKPDIFEKTYELVE